MLEEKKSFFKNKEEQDLFIFWAITLQCEVLPKGFNRLYDIEFDKYCCLGVAACIVIPNEHINFILTGTINVNPFIDYIAEEFSKRTNLYITNLNDEGYSGIEPGITSISHKEIGKKLMEVFEKDLIY